MDNIIQYVTTHQFSVGVAIFVAVLILYFLFKKLIKLVLVLTLILIAIWGYLYFKDPGRVSENIKNSVDKAKQQTGKIVEKGRAVYAKGKGIAQKGAMFSKELKDAVTDSKDEKKEKER